MMHCRKHDARFVFLRCLISIFLFFSGEISLYANENTEPDVIRVILRDAINQQLLVNRDIVAIEILEDGSETWRAKHTTDDKGVAYFNLSGMAQGRAFFFKTKAFSDTWEYSKIISAQTAFEWLVGNVAVSLFDGTQTAQPPLSRYEIQVHQIQPDGTRKWYQRALSDESGLVRLDLPRLAESDQYILRARSPITGEWKFSSTLTIAGSHRFVVGNLPLTVKLMNGFTDQSLSGQPVNAIEILADGSFEWRAKIITGQSGVAQFDLDGLGDGRFYFLKTQAFHDVWVISDIYDQPMTETWVVGSVTANIQDGTKTHPEPIIDHDVHVNEVLADGSSKWFSRVSSDEQGKVYLHLPKVDEGRRFQLKAQSTLSGEWKYSRIIDQVGTLNFVIGNQPLIVKLSDGMTDQPLSQIAVTVLKQLADGTEQWYRRQVSDVNGKLVFELDGLGAGQQFKLKANPFDAGHVTSDFIDQPGQYEFRLGTVPITLMDQATHQALVDQPLVALRVLADGELSWSRRGKTDKNGRVKFDLEELKTGSSFYIKTSNPFGLGQHYYSGRIHTEGPLVMMISKDTGSPLDMKSPMVIVTKPEIDQVANAAGFMLEGLALDNNEISKIHVSVDDTLLGRSEGIADYNKLTKQWQFSIIHAMITAGQPIDIVVRAQDQSNNVAITKMTFPVAIDRYPPNIVFSSHQVDEQVPMTGFTLLGVATDDIGIRDIRASIDDPSLGRTIDRLPLSWDTSTSQWAFSVLNGLISPNADIQITIEAEDGAGHWATEKLSLKVKNGAMDPYHVLNRTSFGVTEDSLEKIKRSGIGDYLTKQLSPENIDDSALEQQLINWQPKSKAELQQYLLYRMAKSERQLLELMAWFWDNHFNTNFNRHGQVAYEFSENHLFRKHALGNFRDLLAISAKSPAMLFYLDSVKNNKSEPNENYARELLELHTMGVDGGYQHHDIEALAKIFTGWHVKNNRFYFNDRQHDYSGKVFLGKTIGGVGLEEGERVLDMLSSHPATARYLCKKLITLFVDDHVLPSLNQTCVTAFLTHQGHIGEVLKTIFASSEFNDIKYRRNKIKTPLEYVLASIRNLDIDYNFHELPRVLSKMGMPLLENDIPTGWSEIGEDWISTDLLLQRIQFAFVLNSWIIRDTPQFWLSRLKQKELFTSEEILGYFNQILFGKNMSKTEWDVALQRLNTLTPIDLDEPDDEYRLRETLTLLMAFPDYQYQ